MGWEFKVKVPDMNEIQEAVRGAHKQATALYEHVSKMAHEMFDSGYPDGWTTENEAKYQAAIKTIEAEPKSGERVAILQMLTSPDMGRRLYLDFVRRGWLE